jgi:hypothetical protein
MAVGHSRADPITRKRRAQLEQLAPRPPKRPRFPWKALVIAFSAGAFGVIAFILAFAASSPDGKKIRAVPVLLTVEASLPVEVRVRHDAAEKQRGEQVLGETPRFVRVSGAHVLDTVVLENATQGAYYEHPIPFGSPNEEILIRKEFRTGHVQFRRTGAVVRALSVFRSNKQLAAFSPDVKIELAEGPHTLEIRGPALQRPVAVAVEVRPGETTVVDPPALPAM